MAVYRGWEGKLMRGYSYSVYPSRLEPSYTIAQVEGWSIDFDGSAEAHFAIGSRTATDVSVGPKNVTGSFNRVWFENVWSQSYAEPATKPLSFVFKGWTKYSEGKSIVATKCFLATWGGAGEADGYATENVDFVAQNVHT